MVDKMAKEKSNKSFFKENYRVSWEFLKQCKNYIYIGLGIFVLFLILGFFIPAPEEISNRILEFIQNVVNEIEGMGPYQLILFIFWNNLKSAFLIFLLGMGFGLFPLGATVVNGYLVGFVARESVFQEGFLVLWRLLPHGIFELPAIFISIGLGLKLGVGIFKERNKFKQNFFKAVIAFVFIVIPLLVIAAIIEGLLIAFSS